MTSSFLTMEISLVIFKKELTFSSSQYFVRMKGMMHVKLNTYKD